MRYRMASALRAANNRRRLLGLPTAAATFTHLPLVRSIRLPPFCVKLVWDRRRQTTPRDEARELEDWRCRPSEPRRKAAREFRSAADRCPRTHQRERAHIDARAPGELVRVRLGDRAPYRAGRRNRAARRRVCMSATRPRARPSQRRRAREALRRRPPSAFQTRHDRAHSARSPHGVPRAARSRWLPT